MKKHVIELSLMPVKDPQHSTEKLLNFQLWFQMRMKINLRSLVVLPLVKTDSKPIDISIRALRISIRTSVHDNYLRHNQTVFLILSTTSRSKVPVVPAISKKYFVWYFARENKRPQWYFVK